MKAQGHYNANSLVQQNAIERTLSMIEAQLHQLTELSLPLPAPINGSQSGPYFTIVDYGSSQGRNSVMFFEKALPFLRKKLPTMPIMLVHNDQQANDWNMLMNTSTREALKDQHVFVLANATSFYDRVMPPNSVDFAFSATAFHWLPLPLPEIKPEEEAMALTSIFVRPLPEPLRSRYKAHGLQAWDRNLRIRFEELKPGGRIVICIPVAIQGKVPNAWAKLSETLRALADEGMLPKSELAHIKLPTWRIDTDQEFFGPILSAGFELEAIDKHSVPDPFKADLEATGNRAAYAEKVCEWMRSATEPSMAAQIAVERRVVVCETLFTRFRALAEADATIETPPNLFRIVALKKPM